VNFIVVLEPSRQQSDYGLSIRQERQPSIVAFEGFDECLRDAVGFRRADWRETKLEAQGRCGVERVLGDVSRAVVGRWVAMLISYAKGRRPFALFKAWRSRPPKGVFTLGGSAA
jgi:hypothetical protein